MNQTVQGDDAGADRFGAALRTAPLDHQSNGLFSRDLKRHAHGDHNVVIGTMEVGDGNLFACAEGQS